jgi:hypothetical protein
MVPPSTVMPVSVHFWSKVPVAISTISPMMSHASGLLRARISHDLLCVHEDGLHWFDRHMFCIFLRSRSYFCTSFCRFTSLQLHIFDHNVSHSESLYSWSDCLPVVSVHCEIFSSMPVAEMLFPRASRQPTSGCLQRAVLWRDQVANATGLMQIAKTPDVLLSGHKKNTILP